MIPELIVPDMWESVPIWSFARRKDQTNVPDAELLSVYRDHGVIPKSSRSDNFNKPSDDLSSYRYVEVGDLVLNKMKTWQGSLAVSQYAGIVSPAYYVCSLSSDVNSRFIHYLLRSQPYISAYLALSKGIRVNQWDLPYEEFKKIRAIMPPSNQQQQIADFLDEQVAIIDRIIELRSRQLVLLKNHYFSSLAELYEAPASPSYLETPSSTSISLKHYIQRTIAGGTPSTGDPVFWTDTGGTPWLAIGDMVDGGISKSTQKQLTDKGVAKVNLTAAPPGTLLFAMYASVGKVTVTGTPAVWNQAIIGLVPKEDVNTQFLMGWLELCRDSFPAIARTATQNNLNADQVRNLRVPHVSFEKQVHVGRLRNTLQENTRRAASAIENSIDLLKERKRSLITATVTGQLDVTTASNRAAKTIIEENGK